MLTGTVTIYGHDSDPDSPCSSTTYQLAELATCYNASWVYYSIDMCTLPMPGSTSTSTSSAAAATVTVSASSSSSNHTGAIVGGIVGGVGGLALILGLAWWLLWSRRRRCQQQLHPQMQMPMPPPVQPSYPVYNTNASHPPPPPPPQELSSKSRVEMPNTGKTIKPEVRDVKDVKLLAPDGRYYAELPGQPIV